MHYEKCSCVCCDDSLNRILAVWYRKLLLIWILAPFCTWTGDLPRQRPATWRPSHWNLPTPSPSTTWPSFATWWHLKALDDLHLSRHNLLLVLSLFADGSWLGAWTPRRRLGTNSFVLWLTMSCDYCPMTLCDTCDVLRFVRKSLVVT